MLFQGRRFPKSSDKLENVTAKVFWYVEQHPEKLSDIQNFYELLSAYYIEAGQRLP